MGISSDLQKRLSKVKTDLENNEELDKPELLNILKKLDAELADYDEDYNKQNSAKRFAQAQVQQQYGIIDALSEGYSAIYVITTDTKLIIPIRQPQNLEEFGVIIDPDWTYEVILENYVETNVHTEDRISLKEAMRFDHICDYLKENSIYFHHFRVIRNDEIHYYYLKATRVESADVLNAIMLGFVCEDESKEKETLRTMSETDIMTKLLNRGTGEKKTRELMQLNQNGLFCMLDIDKFKTINDTFGHSVGDEVIIRVAHELKAAFRSEDIVFRLGGDEFAVYAPGILSRKIGIMILRGFIRQIQLIDIPALQGRSIEVSIGAVLTWGEEINFENIYNKADAGVYISKKTDSNAITFYPDTECIAVE